MSKLNLYSSYNNMMGRCYRKTYASYSSHGGRGITVCEEWRNNPEAFILWALANGYREDLTLDRIDNDKGYSPDNCRWVTCKENERNRRNNIWLTYRGERVLLAELAERAGIKYSTFRSRIYRCGWSVEAAVETPIHKKSRPSVVETDGRQGKYC